MTRNLETSLTLRFKDELTSSASKSLRELSAKSKSAEQSLSGVAKAGNALVPVVKAPQAVSQAMKDLAAQAKVAGVAVQAMAPAAQAPQAVSRAMMELARQSKVAEQALGSASASAQMLGRTPAPTSTIDGLRQMIRQARLAERAMQGLRDLAQRAMTAGGTAVRAYGGIAAGGAAAGYIMAQPISRAMSYDRRLAGMANTAYSDRDLAGRQRGMRELDTSIRGAVRAGGGTREGAAETLDTLLASGAMSEKSAKNLLPTLQKYSTASDTSANDLAKISIRSMQTFGIKEEELPKALDMAIAAGQAGGFELKDMAKWLPQQMASARESGMNGMSGLAKLLAVNQAAVITAGSKDEAGNNMVNLLAKINSVDTARDASKISATTFREKKKGEKGIDLAGSLAIGRAKGIDSLDVFVNLAEKIVAADPRYKKIQSQLKTATGGERKALLESQGDILQGSAVGGLIQDRQALMALVGYMGNREYVKGIESKLPMSTGTGQANFDLIQSTASHKVERLENEKAISEQDAFGNMSGVIGDVAGKLADYAQQYPALTASLTVATTSLNALAAAAAASGLMNILSGGKTPGAPIKKVPTAVVSGAVNAGATVASVATRVVPAIASMAATIGAIPLALAAMFGGTLAVIGSRITDEDRKNATKTQRTSRFGGRDAPSPVAPIPQPGTAQPSYAKLDAAATKMQAAANTPQIVHVKGELRMNGADLVAAIDQRQTTTARRQ